MSDAQVEWLNRDCYCVTVDPAALRSHAPAEVDIEPFLGMFARVPVFVSRQHVDAMQALIDAIERVVALPAWRDAALARAPAVAAVNHGPSGVFMGYDFHLDATGPRLIEINTNAGGAWLNLALARAQRACCDAVRGLMNGPLSLEQVELQILDMFRVEWRKQRGDAELRSIAIVDDQTDRQPLRAEFELAARMFRAAGLTVVVCDPQRLQLRQHVLWHDEIPVDLVYNRLTDFYLAEPAHASLRDAYVSGAVVLTPHPRAHALYADKRNLALLGDAGLPGRDLLGEETIARLQAGVPHTRLVQGADADKLWAQRKRLFFKPATGYGSKAAYRGDKLSRRVWAEILAGDYVAQELVPPSERVVHSAETGRESLKLDLRAYVYEGRMQLLAARLYQGQTTNFRTPGGGFATVFCP